MAQITKEQIIDLINKKIAGQGSAVDVGGALPAILAGLAEMGISSDMTEAEQMQARKELGLYYEAQEPGEKTAEWTDETESPTLSGYAKISDDAPAKEDIIKTVISDTEVSYTTSDREDGYSISIPAALLTNAFIIVENDSQGNTPGIYCQLGTSLIKLIYNGTVDVVSKVPEKFLPIGWNQLVTEGTKIAELMIGNEKTNVFAPNGGGGLPWLDLTGGYDVPSDGNEQDLSWMISQSDWEKLLAGEYAGIHTPENVGSFVSERFRFCLSTCNGLTGWGAVAKYCVFSDGSATLSGVGVLNAVSQSFLFIVGSNITSVAIRRVTMPTSAIPRVLAVTGLPSAGTEIAASGLALMGFAFGQDFDPSNITSITYTDSSGNKYLSPVKIENPANGWTKYSFDMAGNRYDIQFEGLEATVVVTPLS